VAIEGYTFSPVRQTTKGVTAAPAVVVQGHTISENAPAVTIGGNAVGYSAGSVYVRSNAASIPSPALPDQQQQPQNPPPQSSVD